MAEQGTTTDFLQLLKGLADENIPFAPPGEILIIFDPPNTYERAIGFFFDAPRLEPEGGLDAPFD